MVRLRLLSTVTAFAVVAVLFAAAPSKASADVPTLKPYDFAMVAGKLLIVDPSDKKIVDVISG